MNWQDYQVTLSSGVTLAELSDTLTGQKILCEILDVNDTAHYKPVAMTIVNSADGLVTAELSVGEPTALEYGRFKWRLITHDEFYIRVESFAKGQIK